MTTAKIFLPLLAASTLLGGCVYEEVDTRYREPQRVYHSGYDEREVVERRRPEYYDERPRGYYRERPVAVYEDRPQTYYDDRPRGYGGGYLAVPGRRGESFEDRQRRELREAQREQEERHEKKKDDDDHKKKKKKDRDD